MPSFHLATALVQSNQSILKANLVRMDLRGSKEIKAGLLPLLVTTIIINVVDLDPKNTEAD